VNVGAVASVDTGILNPEPEPPILVFGIVNTVVVATPVPPNPATRVTAVTAPPATVMLTTGYVVAAGPLDNVNVTLLYVPLVYNVPPVIVPKVATTPAVTIDGAAISYIDPLVAVDTAQNNLLLM
jgi:hypothetical protein